MSFIYSSHGRPIDPVERLPNYNEIWNAQANLPRFCGHGRGWVRWAVFQHSVAVALLAARLKPKPQRFVEGLFHDASEVFFGDIPTPFKPDVIRAAEEEFHAAFGKKLLADIPWLEAYDPHTVVAEDRVMLSVEAEFYMRIPPTELHRHFPAISETDRRDGIRLYRGLVATDPISVRFQLEAILRSPDPVPEIERLGRAILANSS